MMPMKANISQYVYFTIFVKLNQHKLIIIKEKDMTLGFDGT